MKSAKRIVTLTSQEHRFVIQSLIEVRNELIKEGKQADIYDDLIVKLQRGKYR